MKHREYLIDYYFGGEYVNAVILSSLTIGDVRKRAVVMKPNPDLSYNIKISLASEPHKPLRIFTA